MIDRKKSVGGHETGHVDKIMPLKTHSMRCLIACNISFASDLVGANHYAKQLCIHER